MNIHCKDWWWSWNSNTLAIWYKELIHWKRPRCWEKLKAGGEGGDRGWNDWMASPTQWTWVWASCGSWWWTGKPGVLQSMGLQRVGHDWATELNWKFSHSFVTDSLQPMSCSLLGSSVRGILQQEYWSGLPFPSPGDPVLQMNSLHTEPPGKSYDLFVYPLMSACQECKPFDPVHLFCLSTPSSSYNQLR